MAWFVVGSNLVLFVVLWVQELKPTASAPFTSGTWLPVPSPPYLSACGARICETITGPPLLWPPESECCAIVYSIFCACKPPLTILLVPSWAIELFLPLHRTLGSVSVRPAVGPWVRPEYTTPSWLDLFSIISATLWFGKELESSLHGVPIISVRSLTYFESFSEKFPWRIADSPSPKFPSVDA